MGPGPSEPRLSLWGGSAVRIVKNAICLWHDPEAGEVAPRSIFHLFGSWRIIGGPEEAARAALQSQSLLRAERSQRGS